MKLEQPLDRPSLEKGRKKYQALLRRIHALNQKELTPAFVSHFNPTITGLNQYSDDDKRLAREARALYTQLYKRAISELRLIPKNHHMVIWMSVGMAGMGLPIGVAFSIALENFAFIGIGIPIGLSIGLALGSSMDKKAEQEGRQLNIEV